jgi:TP901 family phage tail tape measure protein
MATAPVTVNANLNFNAASIRAAGNQVQSAFGNINLPSKSINNFNNSLGRITGQASEFDKSINAATARVFAFGAAVSIINGISTAFKGLISSTIEVDKRLTEIGSIIGISVDQLGRFKTAIFDVAKNTGQTFDTVANGAAELARQGLSAEETVKRLNAALILTRVSGLDAEGSVSALTAAINGFTSAGLTAEQIINKLIAVDTAFAVSAKDLAEAFSRAGSTAEDAGVSFDELLGLVTAVQQTTARGGAVIGNAFKSIFSRLSRGTVIDDLKALGVEIDQSQTGIQKLQALSTALANISDPTKANAIKELAGGVYQINIVSAALKDLSSETSIFGRASEIAAKASNEGFEKNVQLNQTLSSQINSLVQGITELGSKIGELTIAPVIQNLLTGANKLLDIFNKVFDPEEGNKLIQGFFKGIGAFISGPGLILVSAAFFKLFQVVAKFAAQGVSDLFKIGSEQERIKNIEGGIVALLQQDASLRATLLSTSATQAQKEQAVINAIKQQNTLLTQQQQLVNSIASAAARAGVGGFTPTGGFSGKGGKGRFAAGYMEEEAMARSLGATSSVKAKMGKGTIDGQKFIMNNQEVEIPNFAGGRDSAVIPLYARGFVPNYANEDDNPLSKVKKADLDTYKKSSKDTNIRGIGTFSQAQILAELTRRQKTKEQKIKKDKLITGTAENRLPIKGNPFGFLVPFLGGEKGQFTESINQKLAISKGKYKGVNFDLTNLDARGPLLPARELEGAKKRKLDISEKIKREVVKAAVSYSRLITSALGNPIIKKSGIEELFAASGGRQGAYGAMQGVIGSAFEAAVVAAVGGKEAAPEGDNFDVNTANKDIDTIFFGGQGQKKKYDFKVSNSQDNVRSFVSKIIADDPNYQTKLKDFFANKAKSKNKSAASGFIPNFNSLNKGIPVSKIRAHFDGMGSPVAVTNTRDEPNGLKDAIGREKKGIGAYTEKMAAGGFIPNFAIAGSLGLLFGLNTALGALGSAFSGLSKEVEEEIETRDELNTKLEEEKGKDNPNIGEIKKIEQALAGLNKNIEAAEEESKKIGGLFSNIATALNLAISAREIASQFGGKGRGNVGNVAGAPQAKSMATKSTLGSAGNFGTQIGNTIIPNAAKIPPTIGPSIGKSLTPAVTKGLGSLGPAIKSFGPKILGSFKSIGPLLGRGVGAVLGGPLGIAATLAPVVGDSLGKFLGERTGAAKELKASKPLDDARTVWIEANSEARKINGELKKLNEAIKKVEGEIAKGGERSLTRSLTNTGELSREAFNKNAAGGSEAQRDRLNIYSDSLMSVNNIARSQKARGPLTLEQDSNLSKERIQEETSLKTKGLKKESQISGQEFAREYGKIIKDFQGGTPILGEIKPTVANADISKTLKDVDKLSNDLLNLDPTNTNQVEFESKQAKLQTELSDKLSSLEFNLNTGAKTEEEKQANKEFIEKLRSNGNAQIAAQTKINNEAIKNEYASRVSILKEEQDILNKFVDDWNSKFSQNLSSFETSLANIKDFNVGSTVSGLGEANFNKGALSNIRDPEERRAALQGRIGAVQQITGQAESLGLTNLLSPEQLTAFKSNLFTQSTLGSGISAVQQNLLSPAASKITEKALGKQITNKEGKVETVGGLQGDAKKAVEQGLYTPIMDSLNKLKEIAKAEGSTGGNILARDIERTQDQLSQSGGGSIEQFTKILSADLSRYGLKEESKIAGQMVQAESLASANQLTDVGLGQNLVTAQDDLSKRTEDLSRLFGSLVDSVKVDKIAELPKVTETIVTSITNLNKELETLKEAANKVHGSLVTAAKAAETAATNLGNIKGAPLTGKPVEVPPAPAQPQGV